MIDFQLGDQIGIDRHQAENFDCILCSLTDTTEPNPQSC